MFLCQHVTKNLFFVRQKTSKNWICWFFFYLVEISRREQQIVCTFLGSFQGKRVSIDLVAPKVWKLNWILLINLCNWIYYAGCSLTRETLKLELFWFVSHSCLIYVSSYVKFNILIDKLGTETNIVIANKLWLLVVELIYSIQLSTVCSAFHIKVFLRGDF